jgi:hypothetical protein
VLFSAGNELERFVSAIFERIARAQEAEPAFAAAALMFLLAGFGLFRLGGGLLCDRRVLSENDRTV